MSVERHKWVISKTKQQLIKQQVLAMGASAGLEPTIKPEQYCDYRLEYKRAQGRLIIKQYTNGTLYVEGSDPGMLAQVKALIEGQGGAGQVAGKTSGTASAASQPPSGPTITIVPPYVGTDESGKGDYFGPLVVAGVLVTPETEQAIQHIGVRDSKTLNDAQIMVQAQALYQALPQGHIASVCLMPTVYNARYEQYKAAGQTLNNLMADLHSQLIAQLLGQAGGVKTVVVDKFGPDATMNRALASVGVSRNVVDVYQFTKAERWLAVAAASVVARAGFVQGIDDLSQQAGMVLPKGAGSPVVKAGKTLARKGGLELLRGVAKLHFKTTDTLFT
ncbi:MAG: ribonuclease HIII [Cyanobacteria bacterium HKST-UBA06]|nr:ribonuclease HIII [Cyanobacteria bacterium HKST-UBA06]